MLNQKIIVDILGGDNAPQSTVEGAILALRENKDIKLVLVGNKDYALPEIEKAGFSDRVEYVHTLESVSYDEMPTVAIKRAGTSMVIGFDMLKKDADCGALVSAGSTGALLAGAFMKIGRIEGVSRPTLCPWLPTKRSDVKMILADAGANVDCKAINLVHFALMTDAYSRLAFGVEKPRIALVNVGTEESKGNELTFQVYEILKKLSEKGVINFVGNMEARDSLSGEYDILIADGFVGNVLLKASEGALALVGDRIKKICSKGFWGRLGGLILRGKFKKMKDDLHEDATGGSPLLGIKKTVVKAHGNASPRAFKNAILTALSASNADLSGEIKKTIDENKQLINDMLADTASA